MELKEITAEEYGSLFDRHAPHTYNTVRFNELNRCKAQSVRYLAFVAPRPLLGIILGERDGKLHSPFSAPFGGMTETEETTIETIAEAYRLLRSYGSENGLQIEITLPPPFYAPTFITRQDAALKAEGTVMWEDVNFHRQLDFGEEGASAQFSSTARRAMRHAERAGLEFHFFKHPTRDDIRRVYETVLSNHHALGYPVKMTEKEVIETTPVTGSRFMTITLGAEDVAAAMFNSVTPTKCQLIYWGDRIMFRPLRPMNLLAAKAFEQCRTLGFKTVDLGPSSECGIVSAGLCRFKQSLGCRPTAKRHFRL